MASLHKASCCSANAFISQPNTSGAASRPKTRRAIVTSQRTWWSFCQSLSQNRPSAAAQSSLFFNQYLLVELNKRAGQLVSPPGAGPRRLAAQAVLENRLQVRRVDGLQLLPVRVAEEGGGEGNEQSLDRWRV